MKMFKPKFFDSHCQLQFSEFDSDRDQIIKRLNENKIFVLNAGSDFFYSEKGLVLAKNYDFIFAGVGFHPANVSFSENGEKFEMGRLKSLIADPFCSAIGECGLDYVYGKDEKIRNEQKEIFKIHLKLAKEFKKPVILHLRPEKNFDAFEQALEILEKEDLQKIMPFPGVAHFFSGNLELAKRFLDLGFFISFSCVITFTEQYDEIIKFVPLEKILVETDAPFAAPAPFRGKRNEPNLVSLAAKRIGEIREKTEEEAGMITATNACRLFDVKYE